MSQIFAQTTATAPGSGSAQGPALPDHLPHDIHGLTPYAFSLADWLWLIILMGVILLSVLAWYFWQRRKKQQQQEVVAIPRLITLAKEIQHHQPTDPFHGPDYFFQLSLLFREYIEGCSPMSATDLTFNELKPLLRKNLPLKKEYVEEIIEFLGRADMIKFANAPTQREEAQKWHEKVCFWTKRLTPMEMLAFGEEH